MRKQGTLWITTGLLLLAAALCLTGYNLLSARLAGQNTDAALKELSIPEAPDPYAANGEPIYPDYLLDPNMDMPTETVDGREYIGVLEIPALSLELPIISQWSYPGLRAAPCRYAGSAYLANMVLCGHNYSRHFGRLDTLEAGDEVRFTDVDGNVFRYAVAEVETLQPTAVEEMTSGDWALSLFTCTVGGRTRITVRCKAIADSIPLS